jgi:hypothetical protein
MSRYLSVSLSLVTTSAVWWSDFLAANGVYSALVRINEEMLERKVAAPV